MQKCCGHVWSLCLLVFLTLIHAHDQVQCVVAGGRIPYLGSKFAATDFETSGPQEVL